MSHSEIKKTRIVFRILIILALTAIAMQTSASPAQNWWNSNWRCRIGLTAYGGLKKMNNAYAVKDLNLAESLRASGVKLPLDSGSLRLIEVSGGRQSEIPFAIRKNAGSSLKIIWRLSGVTSVLVERQYYLYFDTVSSKSKPPSKIGKLKVDRFLPGDNLIVNGDFSEVVNGVPTGWIVQNSEFAKLSTSVRHNGKNSMMLINPGGGAIFQEIKLQPGKKYLYSIWMKVEKCSTNGDISPVIWLHRENAPHIGNYKYSFGTNSQEYDWTYFNQGGFGYVINDKGEPGESGAGEVRYGYGAELLPGTTKGVVTIAPSGTIKAYVSEVSLIEIGDIAEVDAGLPEKLK